MDNFKTRLSDYYNKFNEDKRLSRRHGQVEFMTSIKYIEEYIKPGDRIVDIGAGSGRYSIYLKNQGYDVTAVEYVRPNIGKIKRNDPDIKVIEASATDLSMFKDNEFDVAIMFGPMYHLNDKEDKIKALSEMKRITKRIMFVTYYMNEYGILKHAFIDNNYKDIKDKIDENYHIDDPDNLFFFSRIEDIDELNDICKLKLIKRFASDGPSDYIRTVLNKMDEETFSAYLKYHLKTCERKDLLGASSHIVDILQK
ncbi:MAG: methyltransferase domain-containing protein [Erysipelotrichaceae bacterium]|nr:methyltransferase domain-containing protein [Erysipelotrichaceae bacterium]